MNILAKYLMLLFLTITASTLKSAELATVNNNDSCAEENYIPIQAGSKGGQSYPYSDNVVGKMFINTFNDFTKSIITKNMSSLDDLLYLDSSSSVQSKSGEYKISWLSNGNIRFQCYIKKGNIEYSIETTELTPQELNNILKKQSFWAYLRLRVNIIKDSYE